MMTALLEAPTDAQVTSVYSATGSTVVRLIRKRHILREDIEALCSLERYCVAAEQWSICDPLAQNFLVNDSCLYVRVAARSHA
jgi:hypothetical protein